jgi:hypothetical protein
LERTDLGQGECLVVLRSMDRRWLLDHILPDVKEDGLV